MGNLHKFAPYAARAKSKCAVSEVLERLDELENCAPRLVESLADAARLPWSPTCYERLATRAQPRATAGV